MASSKDDVIKEYCFNTFLAMGARARHPMSIRLAVVGLAALLATTNAPSAFAVTHFTLNFFLHDGVYSGAFDVTPPVVAAPSGSLFGALVVFDEPLTADPNVLSEEIGRARGMYLFDANDKKGPGRNFVWTAQFGNNLTPVANASTLSFQGFDRTTDNTREISVVGGTGTFRQARGYATMTTYYSDGLDSILNVTAIFDYPSS